MSDGGYQPRSQPPPPPGWLEDPWREADLRWWNGLEWTDRTRAADDDDADQSDEAEPAPTDVADEMSRWLILGGSVLLIVGAFLPWVQMTAPLFGRLSMPGIEGDGVITAVAGGLALLAASPLFGRRPLSLGRALAVLVMSVVGGVVSVATARNVAGGVDTLDPEFFGQVGVGLWFTTAASVALFAGGIRAFWDAA